MSKDKIIELQKRLEKLTERHRVWSEGHSKAFEPSITISIGCETDWKWNGSIYSYLMDFHDGGRHHDFRGRTIEELLDNMEKGIAKEERIADVIAKKGGYE